MSKGMMGQGMMGHGMMHHGMMGHGMMGQGPGMRVLPSQHLSIDDVRHFLEHRLARRGNKRLKLGEVTQTDDDTIVADVVTVDDSLVRRMQVDRHTGLMRPVADAMQSMEGKKPKAGMMSMKGKKPKAGMMSMAGMTGMSGPTVPPVTGYSEGREILFIHTEASDPKIAKILTDMMGGSPVLVVPALANVPKEALARVFVFTNGMTGDGPMGPLGGQADIFEHPPGDPAYSPLRAVTLVTWKDADAAHVLKSAAELQSVIDGGAVTTEEPGVVVNMPFLKWPDGQR